MRQEVEKTGERPAAVVGRPVMSADADPELLGFACETGDGWVFAPRRQGRDERDGRRIDLLREPFVGYDDAPLFASLEELLHVVGYAWRQLAERGSFGQRATGFQLRDWVLEVRAEFRAQ